MKWRVWLIVLAVVLAACGTDSDDSTDSASAGEATADFDAGGDDAMEDVETTDDGAAEKDAPADSDADAAEPPLGAGTPVSSQITAAQLGREIIFTARIEVGVDDVVAAGDEAATIIEDIGGFVFGQNTVGGAQARSEITFKVLPEDFDEALRRLSTIGELRNQTVSTDDVTERVVDLESRIRTQELGVERLRAAMEAATDLEDFAELEGLLLARESDLEVMRGQLRTLRDRIDLATITLVLTQERVENNISLFFSVYEGHDDGVGCPGTSANDVVFEDGDEVTMCFDVRNTGDQTLANIEISETVLDIETGDLIEVFGTLDQLAPGQSAIAAYELRPERNQQLRLTVTATPTDGITDEPAGPAVRAGGTPVIRVVEREADPGFTDGFGVAVDVLAALWIAFVVSLGFLLPMLVLIPIALLLWWLGRTLMARSRSRAEERRRANLPPPPAASPADDGAPDQDPADEDAAT